MNQSAYEFSLISDAERQNKDGLSQIDRDLKIYSVASFSIALAFLVLGGLVEFLKYSSTGNVLWSEVIVIVLGSLGLCGIGVYSHLVRTKDSCH